MHETWTYGELRTKEIFNIKRLQSTSSEEEFREKFIPLFVASENCNSPFLNQEMIHLHSLCFPDSLDRVVQSPIKLTQG